MAYCTAPKQTPSETPIEVDRLLPSMTDSARTRKMLIDQLGAQSGPRAYRKYSRQRTGEITSRGILRAVLAPTEAYNCPVFQTAWFFEINAVKGQFARVWPARAYLARPAASRDATPAFGITSNRRSVLHCAKLTGPDKHLTPASRFGSHQDLPHWYRLISRPWGGDGCWAGQGRRARCRDLPRDRVLHAMRDPRVFGGERVSPKPQWV
jgi:hypothetical protein